MAKPLRDSTIFGLVSALAACGGMRPAPPEEGGIPLSEASSVIDEAESAGVFEERLLETALHEDPQIRIRTARALARIGDERGCGAVAKLSDDTIPKVAEAALFAAGALAPKRCLFLARTIVSKLAGQGRAEGVLIRAIEAAGRLGAGAPRERLLGYVDRGSVGTRTAALEALGMAAPELEDGADAIADAAEAALFDDPVEVRAAAIFAMSRLLPNLSERRRKEIASNLEGIARGDSPTKVRSEAVVALAGGGLLSPRLLSSLMEKAPDLVARGLARYRGRSCDLAEAVLPAVAGRLEGRISAASSGEFAPLFRAAAAALLRACPASKKSAGRIDGLLSGDSPHKEAPGAGLVRCLARYVSGAGDIPLVACDPAHPLTGRQLLAARLAERAATDAEARGSLMEMSRSDSPEVMAAAIYALGRVRDGTFRGVLEDLASASDPLAAKAAARALVTAGVAAPAGVGLEPEVRPISHSEKEKARSAPVRVRIRTSRGEVTVELFEKIAPAAVAAFVENARQKVFDDSPIWSVEPGDFVRAGDPTGTGLADVSGWIPWEISEIPFEEGTVGLEGRFGLSSRSRFFVGLSRHPELDGQKTALGRVVEGIEAVRSLLPGDKIESVEVVD